MSVLVNERLSRGKFLIIDVSSGLVGALARSL